MYFFGWPKTDERVSLLGSIHDFLDVYIYRYILGIFGHVVYRYTLGKIVVK